ncbi:MAG: hypothetical protein PHW96_01560 [Candidatus Nanoarchaeia archaeon]|nr:hypothetical protein [Candidatus Nanoarchaeia archaeon]
MKPVYKTILIIGVILGVLVAGGFSTDWFLKENFGVGLLGIFNLFKASFEMSDNSPLMSSFSETELVNALGQQSYESISVSKESSLSSLNSWNNILMDENVRQGQAYQNVKNEVQGIFGDNYSVYMFSVYKSPSITFKVFEWTINIINGDIESFEEGKLLDNYNVKLEVDISIAEDLLLGRATAQQMIEWLTSSNPKMRVSPATELVKIQQIIPVIAEYL